METPIEILDRIISEWAIITKRSDGIIHVHNLIKGSVSIEASKSIVEGRTKLAQNKSHPMLYTSDSPTVTPSEELTEYLLTEERNRLVLADAFVITSFSQRLAAKMYYTLKKPIKPTAFFLNEEQAVQWLRKFVLHKEIQL